MDSRGTVTSNIKDDFVVKKITWKRYEFIGDHSHGSYNFEAIVETDKHSPYDVLLSFDEINKMVQNVSKKFPKECKKLPKFPKAVVHNTPENELKKCQQQLQKYFDVWLKFSVLVKAEEFKQVFRNKGPKEAQSMFMFLNSLQQAADSNCLQALFNIELPEEPKSDSENSFLPPVKTGIANTPMSPSPLLPSLPPHVPSKIEEIPSQDNVIVDSNVNNQNVIQPANDKPSDSSMAPQEIQLLANKTKSFISDYDTQLYRTFTQEIGIKDNKIFRDTLEILEKDQEDYKDLVDKVSGYCISFKSSVQTTGLFLRAIKFYWENRDKRLTPEERKNYIRTKFQQVVDHAKRCQKESEEAAEKLESFAKHLNDQAKILLDRSDEVEKLRVRQRFGGKMGLGALKSLGFALIPLTAPAAGFVKGKNTLEKMSVIIKISNELDEKLERDQREYKNLAKFLQELAEVYKNTAKNIKGQADNWKTIGTMVSICLMRVDNLDNYFNAYSEDPINKEVLDRLERVEKAYNSLSEKVKGYLKQLHQQGMITVPMEQNQYD